MIMSFLQVEYGGSGEREGLGEEGTVEAIFSGSRDEEHNFTSVLFLFSNCFYMRTSWANPISLGLPSVVYVSPAHLN